MKDGALSSYRLADRTCRQLLPLHRWRRGHYILIFSAIFIASIPPSNFIINYYFTLILSSVTGLVLLTCTSSGDHTET